MRGLKRWDSTPYLNSWACTVHLHGSIYSTTILEVNGGSGNISWPSNSVHTSGAMPWDEVKGENIYSSSICHLPCVSTMVVKAILCHERSPICFTTGTCITTSLSMDHICKDPLIFIVDECMFQNGVMHNRGGAVKAKLFYANQTSKLWPIDLW